MHQPMALNFIPKLSAQSIILVMVLAMAPFPLPVRATPKSKETQLSLYLQDITAGPNAADIPLVGISGKVWSYTRFATIHAVDDPITEGLDRNSASVGRAQGLTMTSGLDGRNALVLISIVFTNKEYNDSTFEIQGISKQFEEIRELSVMSGTGKFRFVRAYAIFETVYLNVPNSYDVLRCNVTVKHY